MVLGEDASSTCIEARGKSVPKPQIVLHRVASGVFVVDTGRTAGRCVDNRVLNQEEIRTIRAGVDACDQSIGKVRTPASFRGREPNDIIVIKPIVMRATRIRERPDCRPRDVPIDIIVFYTVAIGPVVEAVLAMTSTGRSVYLCAPKV